MQTANEEDTLNAIFTRLDRGEIDVREAHARVQDYDKRHHSVLDRLLAFLAA
jgi:hypothetical protein